jgi:hypothetical protein
MNLPPLSTPDEADRPLEAIPVLENWVRGTLLGMVAGATVVFTIAVLLDPYQGDGSARTMETHRQMGLPPCTFKTVTLGLGPTQPNGEPDGLPCPSCGMTTSFALLMHGDVLNSLRANAVGTLLATFGLLFIPWALASVWLGRPLFLISLETALMRVVLGFLGLMIVRWVIVLVWIWYHSTSP